MRILLIDDSTPDRELIKRYAKKCATDIAIQGIEIDESEDLNKGLKKLHDNDYDVILLDIFLPGIEANTTVQTTMEYLKKINKNIPIIVITGSQDYSLGKNAFNMGVKDYIVKDELDEKEIARSLIFATYSSTRANPKKILK